MELREYMEIGAEKAGSLTALGKILGQTQPRMSNAKAHKEKLPLDAAARLADYINADLKALIAANELVTEKKAEKLAYWKPFAEHAKAMTLLLAALLFVTLEMTYPQNALANQKLISEDLQKYKLCVFRADSKRQF
jgi:hypothetical protein